MRLDITGASGEHLSELSDHELEAIYGGGVGAGAGSAASLATEERIHSFSVLCDISIFSLNAIVVPILSIANQVTQACLNQD